MMRKGQALKPVSWRPPPARWRRSHHNSIFIWPDDTALVLHERSPLVEAEFPSEPSNCPNRLFLNQLFADGNGDRLSESRAVCVPIKIAVATKDV